MFQALISSLNFREPIDSSEQLIRSHLMCVQKLLQDFISEDSFITPEILNGLSSLNEDVWLRLIASPYVCELLMMKDRSDLIRLQMVHALVAEIQVVNPRLVTEMQPKWTVSGDIVLDEKTRVNFPALKTSCGLQLNYQSHVHNTGKAGIGGYSYETALKFKERIETARSIIERVSPAAHSLIENFTTIIQFRNNETRPSVVNSSTHTSIGLIRCDNFHKLHNDLPEIVDMLVHESTHQYLHLFEEQALPFIDVSGTPKAVVDARDLPSPWSGNPLDLRSYTHAILVWYGLVNFWSQYLESGYQHPEISQVQAEAKLNESLFGFVNSRSVLDNLGHTRKYLNEDYALNIERIQTGLKMKVAN
jgi:hypothetical protein